MNLLSKVQKELLFLKNDNQFNHKNESIFYMIFFKEEKRIFNELFMKE